MYQGFHANKHVLYQLNNKDDRSTQKDVNEDESDDEYDGNEDCTDLYEENCGVSMTEKGQADLFVERFENHNSTTHTKYWILSSGTNVQEVLADYVKTIPEAQKCAK